MQLKYAAGVTLLISMLTACGGSGSESDGDTLSLADASSDDVSSDNESTNTDADSGSADGGNAETDNGATETGESSIDADSTNTGNTINDADTTGTDTDADAGTSDTDTSSASTDENINSTDSDTATNTTDPDSSNANTDSADTATADGTDTSNTPLNDDPGTDVPDTSDNSPFRCCLQEDRTPPASGTVIASSTAPVVSNNVADAPDTGPQPISADNNNSFPGLRFGNLLLLNNAFNAGNQRWDGWSQSISLNDGNPVTAEVVWDWGLESQKFQPFETTAFPEIVYGTKSASERSGTFAETGLPVEEADRPEITISYNYNRTAGVTQAPLGPNDTGAEAADSEHNVIIESFWHDSCDIVRNGSAEDNNVMELLVWYYHGERLPSGSGDIVDRGVLIDGHRWTVYAKSSNFNFLAYVAEDVATAERQSGTINYSAFIQHMLDNDERYGVYEVQPTDCFANILFGPEVFQGAGSFTINDFTITRQY